MNETDLRVAVVHGEVGHDDRYGQGNRQHTGQGTQRAHEHSDCCDRKFK